MEENRGMEKALQNPIILECIFQNLKLKDLKACRQVCGIWNQTTSQAMRASTKVVIYCKHGDPKGPSKFLELVESDEGTFFMAPFVDKFVLCDGPAGIPELWNVCGAQMKSLRLLNVMFYSPDTFRRSIFRSCPNLENLTLYHVEVYGRRVRGPEQWVEPHYSPNKKLVALSIFEDRTRSRFRISLFEILSYYPCLQKLDVFAANSRCEDAFNALEICREHDPNKWRVKEVALDIDGSEAIPLPISFVHVFGEGSNALTSLQIDWIGGGAREDVADAVRKILLANDHSLKKLGLSPDDFSGETDIFPLPGNKVFDKVEVLKLNGFHLRSTRILQAFPNVKTLTLEVDQIPEDPETPHVILHKCTELTLYNYTGDAVGDFQRLFELLPNLRKLKIGCIFNEWFSLICENWPGLTHLELGFGCDVDDIGISGYDKKDVRKINERGGRGRRRSSWRPVTVRRANLSSLKNLRSFFWDLYQEELSNKLTYASLMCGVSELPHLEQFGIPESIEEEVAGQDGLLKSLLQRFQWDGSERITEGF